MPHTSHQSFVELILHNDGLGEKGSRKYSRAEIEDWLDGGHNDDVLSICFEHWSYGDTGTVASILGAKAVDPTQLDSARMAELSGKELAKAKADKLINKIKNSTSKDKSS